jgi:hypothetical protein
VQHEAQLSWEARLGRPAALSAFAAIVFEVVNTVLQVGASQDAPDRDDPLRYGKTLLNFHDNAGGLLGSAITRGVAIFFAAGALFYLFRATRHRRAELPQLVQWLLPLAPVLMTVAVIVNWSGLNDAADRYTSPGGTADVRATPSSEQRTDIAGYCRRRERRPADRRECRITNERREAVAKKLIEDNQGAVGQAALFAGSIALAFAYVIISLNAMRAGLLSRFMGVLGIIVGALIVLPLLPGIPVVQIFWLGALGMLFLGSWPGGRGPAWETGEAMPWPTAQERAGVAAPDEPEPAEPEPEEAAEEPAQPHPVSKKRKRKRRR